VVIIINISDSSNMMETPCQKSKVVIGILFIFILSIQSQGSYAWTGYTHKWICDRIGLDETDCASADYPKVQAEHTDLSFRFHHCTSNSFDCDARTHAANYLLNDSNQSRGFAAHMLSDSMVPVHWYSTDYETCHKIFEDSVEEKLRKADTASYLIFSSRYDLNKWNITMTCLAKFDKEYKNVTMYVDNTYMDLTAKYVAEKLNVKYVEKPSKMIDWTPYAYLLISLLILIFMLFLYAGLKQKKKND
jgi:hypothetical protein